MQDDSIGNVVRFPLKELTKVDKGGKKRWRVEVAIYYPAFELEADSYDDVMNIIADSDWTHGEASFDIEEITEDEEVEISIFENDTFNGSTFMITDSSSNGVISLDTVSQDGLVDAKETLSIFEWVDANADINTTELAKYNVTVNGDTMNLQEAWYMLKGYKALYYDGKESFWNNMVTDGEFDYTDADYVLLKQLADKDDPNYAKAIGQGGKTVEDFKHDKGVVMLASTTTETITLASDPVVGIPVHVSTTYTDATVDTVLADGRTQHDVVRTNTHTSRTPSTITTTTYTLYTYTYTDGSMKNAKGAEAYSNATTYTTAITTEEVIISTTYTAASGEEVDPVEETPVEETPVEETPEVTVVDTVVTETEEYTESKTVYGAQQTISVEDKTTVEDGYTVVKRYTTYANPYSVYHYYNVTTTTVTKYSDGTTKTDTATKQRVNGPDEKAGTQTTTVEEISRTKIVVEEVVDLGPDHADMGTRTPGYVADATHYQTTEFEYLGSKHLSASNFDNAYSSGWTGIPGKNLQMHWLANMISVREGS